MLYRGLHEPKRGEISFEGIRDLQPFFDAAMDAGLYIIARPGMCAAHFPFCISMLISFPSRSIHVSFVVLDNLLPN